MDISKFLGIPYKQYGRDFNGCDCYGLVYLFYKYILGIELPLYSKNYDHNNIQTITDIINNQKKHWIKVNSPREYDCVLFNINGNSNHIGVMLGKNLFLHSAEVRKESCIERLTHPFWEKRLEGFYRYAYNNK